MIFRFEISDYLQELRERFQVPARTGKMPRDATPFQCRPSALMQAVECVHRIGSSAQPHPSGACEQRRGGTPPAAPKTAIAPLRFRLQNPLRHSFSAAFRLCHASYGKTDAKLSSHLAQYACDIINFK